MGLFTRHTDAGEVASLPAREAMTLPQLTVVSADHNWIIAEEDYPSFYDHDPENEGRYYEADPGENCDFHYGCEHTESGGYFGSSGETGRCYCACGFWYDRYAWGL